MNTVRQAFLRNISRRFSTVPSVAVQVEPPPETDKLFKAIELEARGNEPAVLRSFSKFAVTAGHHLGIETRSWNLKKPIHERYTLLKSVHIYKKHRVQYEKRTYYVFVQFSKLTGSTADTLLEYIERNLPEGVALKVTKMEVQELPEHLKSSS